MAAWAVTFPVSIRCHVEPQTSGMNQDASDWELSVFLTCMGTRTGVHHGKNTGNTVKKQREEILMRMLECDTQYLKMENRYQ